MRTVRGRADHVVVVGAGLSGLAAALHQAGRGRAVTVLERYAVPGGRAGRLDVGRYRLDTGPAAGLRWCDVDLDEGVAVISQQLQQYDGHIVASSPKTRHSSRVIALDRTTITALRQHRARQIAEHKIVGKSYRDSGYVFTSLVGDPIAPDRLTRTFHRLCEDAGMPPIRLHDLRHGAATLALAAGVELKVVQDMMGHSSIVLTAETYTSVLTSVLPEVARKAAEAVAVHVLHAGWLVPGTNRPRRRAPVRRRPRQAISIAGMARAHPGRQITRPRLLTA
jgi:integrase